MGLPFPIKSPRWIVELMPLENWRDGRDSNPKASKAQSHSDKGISPLTKEQWTHFSGEDRRMLSQIVERWGDLSNDLKRAVVAVVAESG